MASKSLLLDASSSEYARIVSGSQTNLSPSQVTLETWFKLASQPATDTTYYFLSKRDGAAASDAAYAFAYRDQGGTKKFQFVGSNGSGFISYNTTVDISSVVINKWNHLAVSYNQTNRNTIFYLNGSSIETVGSGAAFALSSAAVDLYIGAIEAGSGIGGEMDGQLFDMRVWSDIRTPTEVSNNYMQLLEGNEAGLVANWVFNGDYTDKTSNNNDLTAFNTPTFTSDVPFGGANSGIFLSF